ncbi:MAG TPA: hypothetical protein PKA33_17850 [Amaricoccus sp.]|uniref:hypothetical protein n=1 Tax=Amaricoccus sp. TaxID=1872485 RepID=UPI002C6E88B1|nr:hypothetical protein [Amaricoccus sp.]HMQ92839.1 hypothetical protein [Amaricoccus sp.]HMR37057.1 hypothetical protein [Paracoccus sp. (in: a-proteobacteria)]HMR54159.1 hypothetical protein [Amaricoccus sp.]HMU01212.1 hypothetical protein [Amaricoccus sp.]
MLGALILWILLAPAIAELIPLVFVFAFLLLRFALLVVWTAVSTAATLLFKALALAFKLGCCGYVSSLVFSFSFRVLLDTPPVRRGGGAGRSRCNTGGLQAEWSGQSH